MSCDSICILLIEDNLGDAWLLRELIAEAGSARFSLTHVDRLSAGLEHLAAGDIEVVLLDLSLPDSQGVETLTRLTTQVPGVPVIVMTGLEDEALGVQLIQAGAQDYLVKGQVTRPLLLRSIHYAIERKRAEVEIFQRNRELLTLQFAGAAITSSQDLSYILDIITREIATLLAVEGCTISEWRETDDAVSILAGYGPLAGQQQAPARVYYLADYPLTRRVLIEQSIHQITLSQAEADPAEVSYMQAAHIRTLLMLPMIFQDRVMGLLEITDSQVERTFTTQEIGLAQLLANQAASAIENTRLHAETERRAQQLAILHELDRTISASLRLDDVYNALTHHTYRLFPHDHLAIILFEDEGPRVTFATPKLKAGLSSGMLLPLKGSAVGWVAGKGQPLLRHQISTDLRFVEEELLVTNGIESSMILPLRSKGQIIGAWSLGSQKVGIYSPDDLTMAQAMADQLAIAIENARLYKQAQQEISERQRAELALRESEKRFRALIDNAADVIVLLGVDGIVTYASPAITKVLGYSPAEYTGLNAFELLHPEELKTCTSLFEDLLQKPGASITAQFRFQHKDSSWRWLEATGCNLLNEPSVQAIVVNFHDVTERKTLEDQLRQSQKMDAIGQLAGGIAHDFNNLLTVITGYSELVLDRHITSNDPWHKYLEEILKAGERAASLTRQLLVFSRKQILELQVLNLNTVVAEMDKMLRRLIGEDVNLVAVLKEGLGQVKADPGQLEQVLMNLAVNARDAMPQGGQLTIETANVELDEAYGRQHAEVQPGPYVMVAVSDTGTGMDRETISHIFEPFFTTKEPGKGTGLGLSTVYGIIKQSDGHLWVYSEIGRGTTFKVYLPRVEEVVEAAETNQARLKQPPRLETILLVEDEERVRELVCTLLQEEGYSMLVAQHGDEALHLCQQYGGPIQLLVTDIVMPGGMNGRQLADRLMPIYPELKVLYMSGYTDEAIVRHGVLEQSMAFLQKPFTLISLLRKVRELLDT